MLARRSHLSLLCGSCVERIRCGSGVYNRVGGDGRGASEGEGGRQGAEGRTDGTGREGPGGRGEGERRGGGLQVSCVGRV